MPFDPNGNFSPVGGTTAVDGEIAQASQHNLFVQDASAGLSQALLADGRRSWSGDQNANGRRLTNLADAINPQDPVTLKQLQAATLGEGSIAFGSRQAAIDAEIGDDVSTILVLHASALLSYVSDAAGTALVTAGGRKWSPADTPTPLHWGAVGDGATDDIIPLQAMSNFFVRTSTDRAVAYFQSPLVVADGLNRTYAISKSWIIGNVGSGSGMLFNWTFQNARLVAIAGDWSGDLVSGVPKQMFVAAWRMDADYTDSNAGIWRVGLINVHLECSYLTGGTFLENTNSVSLIDLRISRVGKSRVGYDTSIGNKAQNPRSYQTGNGALNVIRINVAGLEEEADPNYPSGEDQTTMATIGIRHRTNDAHFDAFIVSRMTQAMNINNCGANQFYNGHPWSREVYIGPNTNNLWFVNCYFDFSTVTLDGSFNHLFDGCTWPLGTAGTNGLFLRATTASTTGDGLVICGGKFTGGIRVHFTTSGGGSWVTDTAKKIVMQGVWIQTPDATSDIAWQQGAAASLTQNGYLTLNSGATLKGQLLMSGYAITQLATPTASAQAANKSYVDSAVSDERMKTDIALLDSDGLDIIKALRPVRFRYRDPTLDEDWGDREDIGLIAQEVEPVIPTAIHYLPPVTINDNGEPVEIERPLGINYASLTVPLILAVQQLAARLEALEEAR